MITYIEPPMYYEGFDNIYLIDGGMYKDLYDYNILINECVDYDQNTPYHNDTLEKHIINTVERVSELAENLGLDLFTERTLVEAAKYHDFGKLYCRTFNENKNTCSYYNHHNVSTYMYLCHIRKQCLVDSFNRVRLSDKKYQVAALILNHMQWYMRDNMQPIKDLFNDDNLFNMLELLHYADKYRK